MGTGLFTYPFTSFAVFPYRDTALCCLDNPTPLGVASALAERSIKVGSEKWKEVNAWKILRCT
jgi:hypothetical protein